MKVQAHRGASGDAPENTAAAFTLARNIGADGIECDVHLTADGYVVISHDACIDRMSTGRGAIMDTTLEELRQFTFGGEFTKYQSERILTLEQLLDIVQTMEIINIEIKDNAKRQLYPGIVEKVWDIVQRFGVEKKVIISSFLPEMLKQAKAISTVWQTGLLYDKMDDPVGFALQLQCDALHPHFRHLTAETVARAKQNGLKINAWTVDHTREIKNMLELGADSVITNYPAKALEVLGRA